MNTSLAPTYKRLLGGYWLLWYKVSNSYSVIDNTFKTVLDLFLQSNTIPEFASRLEIFDPSFDSEIITETLISYLKNCNAPSFNSKKISIEFEKSYRIIEKNYLIKGRLVQIFYDSELVEKVLHPTLAYLLVKSTAKSDITFDIYIKHKQLYLFKNKELICCTPQQEYHRVQGKFTMHLLCFIHNKTEKDWIGTFHGSTITDGNSSLLIIGESGKGKSTLCALLVANGFDLLADDVSPMLSDSKDLYYNPSAISIKEGAFSLLSPLVEGFKNLPIVQFNKSKGLLKYMPCKAPEKNFYPCKGIILVNYEVNAETKLEPVSTKILLETLIPESWLSSNPIHAKEFLDWLDLVKMYQLTYSDTKSVTRDVSQLFHQLNKIE